MGNHYSHMTIKGPPQHELVGYLDEIGRVFAVSPTVSDVTTLFDAVSNRGFFFWGGWRVGAFMPESSFVEHPSAHLSRHFDCVVLAIEVTDGDVLQYQLIRSGFLIDDYDSCPAYPEDYYGPPSGGNAELLCAMFGAEGAVKYVDDVLRYESQPDRRQYAQAEDRHRDLVTALGLPEYAAYMNGLFF